jgi:hypothetical protein
MTDEELLAIERNLFAVARGLVRERVDFPWHRDDSGQCTASCQKSSQALAIDVFETVDRLPSRNRIVGAWAELLRLPLAPADNWELTLEYPLPKALLGELRETQIDVLARSSNGIVVFECKFTEADGGGCSQVH